MAIEGKMLRPLARFFTETHAHTFNKMHNHATWMVGAVGMLGYALRDSDLIAKALYGTRRDSTGGFLRQLETLFSPDGSYRRPVLHPVRHRAVLPARRPSTTIMELKIFGYQDSISEVLSPQSADDAGRYVHSRMT
jgi:hypothetical protein